MNYNTLVFIGNSHISQFLVDNNQNVEQLHFPGASIKGLANKNSTTGLSKMVDNYDFNNKLAIFFLGQCDVEFGYYYKSVILGKKLLFEEYADEVIEVYRDYLANFNSPFIILGINPCTVNDMRHNFYVNWHDKPCHVQNTINSTGKLNLEMKFEDYTHIYNDDISVRNNNHKIFNSKLRKMSEKNNFHFIDMFDEICDHEGNVKSEYQNSNGDHHLRPSHRLFQILESKIFEI